MGDPAGAGRATSDGADARYAMRALDRIVAILTYLGEQGPSTFADVAEGTGLARPTVFRLLSALERHGFVDWVEGAGFRLGPRLLFLTLKGSGIMDLRLAAWPVMQRLSGQTRETVALSVRVGQQRIYVAQVESSQPVRRVVEVNQFLPLHCGASGKVLLAWLPDPVRPGFVSRLPMLRFTERTLTDPHELLAELEGVRRRGYALSFGERVADGAALAAPILSESGEAVGALAVIAPAHRSPEETLRGWVPLLQQAARDVAVAYGAIRPASPARAEVRRRSGRAGR